MRMLFVVSSDVFDAGLSIINALKHRIELNCLLTVIPHYPNMLSVSNKDFKDSQLIEAQNVNYLQRYSSFIPIESTKILATHSIKKLKLFIQSCKAISTFIMDVNPDVIVYYINPGEQWIPFLLTNNIPVISVVHDPSFHSSQTRQTFHKFIRRIVFSHIDAFFVLSNNLKSDFEHSKEVGGKPVFLSRLGRYESLCACNKYKDYHPSSKLRMLFFGRIEGYKGLKYLLLAFKMLKSENRSVELTILGRGYIEDDIIDLNSTKDLIIQNSYIEEKDLVNAINSCDIVICPYIDATQSGVIMSAFAFNKPVIATNVGGLKEMVIDGRYGRIIEPANVDALVSAILEIYDNRDILVNWRNNIMNDYEKGINSWNCISDDFVRDIQFVMSKY